MKVIRELRRGAGLTQRQLAEAIGRTQVYVSTLETGARQLISFEDGLALARAFKISPERLEELLDAEATSNKADSAALTLEQALVEQAARLPV